MKAITQTADSILNSVFDGTNTKQEINRILDKFGLNWNVEKTPLMCAGANTDYYGIHKTGQPNNLFTTAKSDYEVYQNNELIDLLLTVSEKTGYALHKGGQLKDGALVYAQFESPNTIHIGDKKHEVKGYITGLNSHDGTKSLGFGETNVTIICMNTFHQAFKQVKNKVRHTENMRNRIDAIIREINGVISEETNLFNTYKQLSEIKVTNKNVLTLIETITGVDMSLTKSELEKYTTYSINRANDFRLAIGKELAEKGDTLWGLFNGVTQYTNHVLTTPKRDNAQFESILTGSAYKINNEGFHAIKKMAMIEA